MRGLLAVFLTRSSPKATVFISGYGPSMQSRPDFGLRFQEKVLQSF